MATALIICVCALTALMTAAPTEDLYLTNATLVDPAARQLQRGNLLIRNGRIEAAPSKAPAGFIGRTLDLKCARWRAAPQALPARLGRAKIPMPPRPEQ